MPRENSRQKIEVHVSCVCIRMNGSTCEVLLGRRADWREIFGGYWECGGGQVHINQTFDDAVKSQILEEFGINVSVLFPFASYKIDLGDDRGLIPGIRFICTPLGECIINIDRNEIVDYAWSPPEGLDNYRLIPGILHDIQMAFSIYRNNY